MLILQAVLRIEGYGTVWEEHSFSFESGVLTLKAYGDITVKRMEFEGSAFVITQKKEGCSPLILELVNLEWEYIQERNKTLLPFERWVIRHLGLPCNYWWSMTNEEMKSCLVVSIYCVLDHSSVCDMQTLRKGIWEAGGKLLPGCFGYHMMPRNAQRIRTFMPETCCLPVLTALQTFQGMQIWKLHWSGSYTWADLNLMWRLWCYCFQMMPANFAQNVLPTL